jgi:hypothetical protein
MLIFGKRLHDSKPEPAGTCARRGFAGEALSRQGWLGGLSIHFDEPRALANPQNCLALTDRKSGLIVLLHWEHVQGGNLENK